MLRNEPLAPSLKLRFYPEATLRKGVVHSPFNILSRDLIRTIFCYLGDVKSVKQVRRACRLFYVDSEVRLVEILARKLKLPIKQGSLLDDFRPAVKLKLLLTHFINNYVELNLTKRRVCFFYRKLSTCEEEMEKIMWHLTCYRDSEQPIIKNTLFILEHRSSCLNIKLGLIILTRLPKEHWLRGIQSQDNRFLQIKLNHEGKLISTSETTTLKNDEKVWLAYYDPYQELEVLIDQMQAELQEMRKILKKTKK